LFLSPHGEGKGFLFKGGNNMCHYLSGWVVRQDDGQGYRVIARSGDMHHEDIAARENIDDSGRVDVARVELHRIGDVLFWRPCRPEWIDDTAAADVRDTLQRVIAADMAETIDAQIRAADEIEAVRQSVLAAIVEGATLPAVPGRLAKTVTAALADYRHIGREIRSARASYCMDMDTVQSKKLRDKIAQYRDSQKSAQWAGRQAWSGDADCRWMIVGAEAREWDKRTGYQHRHGFSASSRRTGYTLTLYRYRAGICREIKSVPVREFSRPTQIAAETERLEKWAKRYVAKWRT
jgi:hypothetical protein